MFRCIQLLFGTLIVIHALVSGGETFTYSASGADIFEVVVAGKADDKGLSPGIYKFNSKTGEPEPLVLGVPNGVSKAFKGVLTFISPSVGVGSANEVLALINGRITLLNYNSSPNSSKSYIAIGEKGPQGLSLSDVLSGRIVDVPKIDHPEEVSIVDGGIRTTEEGNEKLFLISIRAPNHSGSGLTFALNVRMSGKDDKVAVIGSRTVILSYDFMTDRQMERMLLAQRAQGHVYVVSPLVVESTKVQLPPSDQSAVTYRWKRHLDHAIDYIFNGKSKTDVIPTTTKKETEASDVFSGVPVYDLTIGRQVLHEYPIEPVVQEVWGQLAMIYDPFSQRYRLADLPQTVASDLKTLNVSGGQLSFIDTASAKLRSMGELGVDRDPKSGKYLIDGISWDNSENDGRFLMNGFEAGDKQVIATHHMASLFFSHSSPYLAMRSKSSGIYEVLSLNKGEFGQSITPGSKIEFIRAGIFEFNHKKVHVFLVSAKKERSKNGSVWNLVVEETASLRLVRVEPLMENTPFVSAKELVFRLVIPHINNPIFDNITPVLGPAAYIKEKSANGESVPTTRTAIVGARKTPYIRLLKDSLGLPGLVKSAFGDQVYLKALVHHPLINRQLYFTQYEAKGASKDFTGFWSVFKEPGMEEEFSRLEVLGRPLINRVDRQTKATIHLLEQRTLQFTKGVKEDMSSLRVTIFPFTSLSAKSGREVGSLKSFSLGIFISAGDSISSNTVFRQIGFDIPFQSLAYSKIIQGEKSTSDNYYILLFFREDEKIPNSKDAVFVINGSVDMAALNSNRVVSVIQDKKKIFGNFVGPSEYKSHLMIDPQGRYYWVDNPGASINSTEIKVRRLTEAEKYLPVRSPSIAVLREAEGIKDSDIGYSNKRLRRGGFWELWNSMAIKQKVPGLEGEGASPAGGTAASSGGQESSGSGDGSEGGEKNKIKRTSSESKAEQSLYDRLNGFLDEFVESKEPGRIEVLLVEPSLKEGFKRALFSQLIKGDGKFSLSSNAIRFNYADRSLDDIEIADEMEFINQTRSGRRGGPVKSVLYVEPELLLDYKVSTRGVLFDEEGEDQETTSKAKADDPDAHLEDPRFRFNHDKTTDPADFLSLLVSSGRAKTPMGVKELKGQYSPPNTLVVMTMAEWRRVKAKNKTAKDFGLFDKFNINLDFLTSSWTMWPPKSGRMSDDLKALERDGLFHPEEMAVFPSLDRILSDAATGKLRGRQKIVIVPPELLPIVNKLIWLRWVNPDVSQTLPWSHANKDLALFRLSPNGSQSDIQDNFRSVVGASLYRNSVLIGDLDAVERLGRPINPKSVRNFFLRDPIKGKTTYLLSETEAELIRNSSNGEEGGQNSGNPKAPLSGTDIDIQELEENLNSLNDEIDAVQEEISAIASDRDSLTIEERNARFSEMNIELQKLAADRDELKAIIGFVESSMEAEQEETSPSNESRVLPHALWLIGAEGKTVQPRADVNWSLGKSVHRRATTILVGTQEQFNRISAELDFEMQFFSLQDHFEVEYLEPPSDDTKVKLIQSLFNLPEIQNLKFHFAIKGESLEARSQMQLIHHFVNRVDHIAYDLRMDRTTAFVKSFIVLKNSLIEDSELRRSRRIDENVVDRLFTKVFPMALNIDILEPSDPLRKVQKVDEAVRRLDQLGYRGSSDLKRRFLETYLSQTRPVDTSRPIPNSQLLFGGTGSGKTELILKFFEMLELKEYVSNKPSNEEADYLFIKVGDLTEKEANEPGKMSVERMVIDIYDFLSQPKGARGHLVFDDFHKAVSVQVRKRLFQVVQSLFDAKAGMITVRSKKGERVREIPVQNLNLYMTLNPTTNEARRKEYLDSNKYYSDADRLKREVLAALSDKDFDPEESVLARWADIINMKHFPRSAKVPELAAKVRETTRTSSGRIVLVDPEVIDLLVEKFPGANARQLLAPATAALTYVPSTAAESRLYLVTKKDWQFNFVENQGDPLDGIGVIQGQVNQSQLQSAVRQITQIDPINIKDMRSFVDFMAFLMREFRLQLFNGLVLEANMSDLLTLNIVGQTKVIRNSFIIGLADHIVGQLALPKGEIIVQPEQLGFFTRDESEELYELLASYRKDTKSYFPLSFHHKGYSEFGNLDEFLKGTKPFWIKSRSRQDVMAEYTKKLQGALRTYLQLFLRFSGSDKLSHMANLSRAELEKWFRNLPEQAPDVEARQLYSGLITMFSEFMADFNSEFLEEAAREDFGQVTYYDHARIFGFILDSAVLSLPWANVGKFLLDVIETSRDHEFGSRPYYKEYLGAQNHSPFGITTASFLLDMGNVAKGESGMTEESLHRRRSGFGGLCSSLLSREGRE